MLLREDFGYGLHALTRKVAVDTRVARTGIGIARNLGFCLGVGFEPLGEGGNLGCLIFCHLRFGEGETHGQAFAFGFLLHGLRLRLDFGLGLRLRSRLRDGRGGSRLRLFGLRCRRGGRRGLHWCGLRHVNGLCGLLLAAEAEVHAEEGLQLPVAVAVDFGVETVLQVVGGYFEVDADEFRHVGFELQAHAEVVHEAAVVPAEMLVAVSEGGSSEVLEVVVVPRHAEAGTADEVEVHKRFLARSEDAAEVEHEVEVGDGVVVVVLLTRIAEAALIVDAAHVQACADGGGEHGTHVDAAYGRDEFRGVVVGKGGLRSALNAGEEVGIGAGLRVLALLCSGRGDHCQREQGGCEKF